MTLAYVGLGSNLGDRLANLRQAVSLLGRAAGVRVLRTSRIYETAAVGGPPQGPFLNAVAEVDVVGGSARSLLNACLGVEARMGRVRDERWGPRLIDLDVLLFGDERIEEPDLVVPHPRMTERAFVLVPLGDLVPDRAPRQVGDEVRLFGPPIDLPA